MLSSVSKVVVRRAAMSLSARSANMVAPASSPSTTSLSLSSSSVRRPLFAIRWYRGDSGDAVNDLSANEEALLKIAKPKADAIRAKHIEIPDSDDADALETRRKRLIYRAKQRGWLEVDLLLGTWANENVPTLEGDELDQFEDFVNMETIDIYNVITLRLDVPEEMKRADGNGVVERIQEWARSSPLGKADPQKYKDVKTEAGLI